MRKYFMNLGKTRKQISKLGFIVLAHEMQNAKCKMHN